MPLEKPKKKGYAYHGGCRISHLPPAFDEERENSTPSSLNLTVTFEEALKLALAMQGCLLRLNRHDRRTAKGKNMGMGITLKFGPKQISIFESSI